jgi:hypothetical protein
MVNRGLLWILAGVALLLALFDPVLAPFFPTCPFHALTGLHCPGCGSTRALHALFTGHPLQAAGFNVLAVLAVPAVLFILIRRPSSHQVRQVWIVTFLIVVILFGIVRNIPWQPFSLLAP